MVRFRITYGPPSELLHTIESEMRRGVLLIGVEPPSGLEFRAPVSVEIATAAGAVTFTTEVVSLLPTVGVAVSVSPEKIDEMRMLAQNTPEGDNEPALHEVVQDGEPAKPSGQTPQTAPTPFAKMTFGEKVQVALHGTKEDRAAILRDQNKQLHPFVLKSPHVSPEEVAGWAANPQASADFLKQIAERKEWLQRPAIALAIARNPKTPADLGVRALDYVSIEFLKQFSKGVGALPHIVQAARKKILPK